MTHALVQSKKKLVDTTLNFIVTQRVNFYLCCFPRIGKYNKFKYLIFHSSICKCFHKHCHTCSENNPFFNPSTVAIPLNWIHKKKQKKNEGVSVVVVCVVDSCPAIHAPQWRMSGGLIKISCHKSVSSKRIIRCLFSICYWICCVQVFQQRSLTIEASVVSKRCGKFPDFSHQT